MRQIFLDVSADSSRTIAEQIPEAYKDVEEVVKDAEIGKLAKIVAKLKRRHVIKG